MGSSRALTRLGAAVVVAALVAVSACSGDDSKDDAEPAGESSEAITIEVLSSRPELVTDGDARLAVTLAEEVDPAELEVVAGDADVTEKFTASPDPANDRRFVAVVDGLADGDTEIEARAGEASTSLTLTSQPSTGPLFSGEQRALAVCTTETFGLSASSPEQGCFAPTKVTWQYVDTAGTLKDLADPTAPPADAEQIATDAGAVPFIVRNETGVLNRSVYRITLLEAHPNAANPEDEIDTSGWNERLIYRFGGGCGSIPTQGYFGMGPPSLELLRQGYAAATATFNTFQVVCNDVISAETASMVKEHFVEAYGEVEHTIGEGGSGGAIQQILLAQNQPGLLDAIAPGVPFPDALSISGGVFDCAALSNYYESPAGSQLTPEQRVAINGHMVAETCGLWDSTFATNIDPAAGCGFDVASAFGAAESLPTLPAEEIYNPTSNPDGVRCTVWEANSTITGRDTATGFARSGYDNTGVQYGLDALNAGAITVDQFLDLNEKVGGFDIDGQPQPERSAVDDELAARAYATGRVSGPWGGLPDTPMILMNVYTDPVGDIHDRVRSFSLLDRLSDEDGNWPATVSLWTYGAAPGSGLLDTLTGALGERAAEPTLLLDEWLTKAKQRQADAGGSWQEALAASKPDAAQSRCVIYGQEPIVGPDANDDPACVAAFPIHEEPRMAAGAPRSGDILKCQLIAVEDAADRYEVELSDAQLDRLADIFPDGVCDYSQPGIGQSEPDGTWPHFD